MQVTCYKGNLHVNFGLSRSFCSNETSTRQTDGQIRCNAKDGHINNIKPQSMKHYRQKMTTNLFRWHWKRHQVEINRLQAVEVSATTQHQIQSSIFITFYNVFAHFAPLIFHSCNSVCNIITSIIHHSLNNHCHKPLIIITAFIFINTIVTYILYNNVHIITRN